MKNIWIFNHYSFPYDKTEIRHFKFAKFLIKKGYNVKIFASSFIHNSDKNLIEDDKKHICKIIEGVPYIFVKTRNYSGNGKRRIFNMFDYFFRVLKYSRYYSSNSNPDIIIASSVHPLTWIAGYILSKRYKSKFIAETRDLWPETLIAFKKIEKSSIVAKILYKIEKFIYKKADKLIFTMPGGKDYVKNIGLNTDKVVYINNGVDLDEFNENKLLYKYKDNDLENTSIFKVLYTGSMGVANYLNYLLDAAKIIQDRGINNIRFILFGDGYQKKNLMEYAKKNDIRNVIFKNKVEKKYIPNILSKSNLNVLLAKNISIYKYGISFNKLFDYLASGKPILSNINFKYNILLQYRCGMISKEDSPKSLAEGILKFYNMPKVEYDTYCRNALKAVEDFDYKVLSHELEKIIVSILPIR